MIHSARASTKEIIGMINGLLNVILGKSKYKTVGKKIIDALNVTELGIKGRDSFGQLMISETVKAGKEPRI